jgi:hypothetical protein
MYVVESNRNLYLTNIPVLGKVPVFCWFSHSTQNTRLQVIYGFHHELQNNLSEMFTQFLVE